MSDVAMYAFTLPFPIEPSALCGHASPSAESASLSSSDSSAECASLYSSDSSGKRVASTASTAS